MFNKSQNHSCDVTFKEIMTTWEKERRSLNLDKRNHTGFCPVPKQYSVINLKKMHVTTGIVKCSLVVVFCMLGVQCVKTCFFNLLSLSFFIPF